MANRVNFGRLSYNIDLNTKYSKDTKEYKRKKKCFSFVRLGALGVKKIPPGAGGGKGEKPACVRRGGAEQDAGGGLALMTP